MQLRAILATILWGSAFAGAKIGLQYAEPILLSGMRFVLAGLLLIPVARFNNVSFRKELKNWRFMLVFALLQTYVQYGLFFLGINKVPAATSAIVIGSGPLIVAVLAHYIMQNEKMSFRKIFAILLGLSGVVFMSITKGSMIGSDPVFYIGILLLLLSTLAGGYTNIMLSQRKERQISPILLTSVAHLIGGALLLLTSLVFERPQSFRFPPEYWGALFWLAIISSTGFTLWYGLLNRPQVKVSELNIWKFLIPVTGTIFSWLFVKGESPDYPTVVGIIITTIALLLMQIPERFFRVNNQEPRTKTGRRSF